MGGRLDTHTNDFLAPKVEAVGRGWEFAGLSRPTFVFGPSSRLFAALRTLVAIGAKRTFWRSPPLQLQPRILSRQISSIGAVARTPLFSAPKGPRTDWDAVASNSCRTGLDRRSEGCGQNRPCWIDLDFRLAPQPEYWTRAGSLAKTTSGDRRSFSWRTLRSHLWQ